MNKTLDYYLSLPYTLEIIPDIEECGYVAKVRELPGCLTLADIWEELKCMVEEAKRAWLEVALEYTHAIPEPLGLFT